jgi:hypothetical protein
MVRAMSLKPADWERVEPLFERRSTWILIPGSRDAYAPLFEGTLSEAVAEAFKHATFWETTTTVLYAPEGRYRGEHTPIVKVSPISSPPAAPRA